MGAEYYSTKIPFKDNETNEKLVASYNDFCSTLLTQQAYIEAEYAVINPTNVKKTIEEIADELIDADDQSLYGYTGNFLSDEKGLEIIEDTIFFSEADAKKFVEEHNQKWQQPTAVKVLDSEAYWYIGSWCSS